MRKVLLIEAQIKQYRLPFYEQLYSMLGADHIELKVGYSNPSSVEATKKDTCDLPLNYGMKVKGYWLLHEKLLFQSLFRTAITADLVVVDQGNKFLLNYILLPLSHMGIRRVAFWGLGKNCEDSQLRLSEWYRRKTLNWVSWWFAYTKGTSSYLVENRVPPLKITVVENAIDTRQIREHTEGIQMEERAALRRRLGIPLSAPVGIFCGALHKAKSIPFLIEASKLIRARIPDFHLIVLGGGPEESSVCAFVQGNSWMHMMGPRFGKAKSELLAISDAFLMPGAVGLVILDAFAAGLPLLSTRLNIHGPEMEYLAEGINGLISEPTVPAFADMATSLLLNRDVLDRLKAGARESGVKYTIENMVANFREGIHQCLGSSALPSAARILQRE